MPHLFDPVDFIIKYVADNTNCEAPLHRVIFSPSCYILSLKCSYSPQTLFSSILSLCPSPHVRDQVPCPYKTLNKL
jgi:hypothetical protein